MNQPAIFKVSAVVGQYQTSANPLLLQQYENQEMQEITQKEITNTEILPTIATHISEAIRDIENLQENVIQTVISQDLPQNIPIQTPITEKQLDITPYKKQLEALMQEEKPYLEPQLTLPELATQMQISLHLLSKVINDGYDKNFHDFINSYRIDEFKTLILQPKYRHQTILAVALDAGFNSKTAFNRAFKKLTNSTPREFLKQQSLGEMKDE
jgi:AraC-like DNA-binding protein